MSEPVFRRVVAGFVLLALGSCGDLATLPESAGFGPEPALPPPHPTLIPTVQIAPAKGWPSGATPVAAAGLTVNAYATGLDHPRWLHVLPNGDVLVAESNGPPRPDDARGIKGWAAGLIMERAGATAPSANRITLLRDTDGDGIADFRSSLLTGLNSPFGMALVGDQLFVANTDAVLRFPYQAGDTGITATGIRVVDLPAGTINHHWTRNIIASRDGSRLYVTVGSNSNVGENGMENETNRAAILEVDPATGHWRLFASGLRNPNGLDWEPLTGALWTTVNERDEIGSDLVPDFMTAVQDGAFYGWPYSYFGRHVDARVKPERPDLVARAVVPDYALGAHTASLGLVFYRGDTVAGALFRRGVHRPARLVESAAAERLQGHLRGLCQWTSRWRPGGRADRLRRCGRKCSWSSRRSGGGPGRRAARRGRRRQRHLARTVERRRVCSKPVARTEA